MAESLPSSEPWPWDHLCSSQMPGVSKGTLGKWKSSRKKKLVATQEL